MVYSCNDYCKIEAGWGCAGTRPSVCTEVCGDGLDFHSFINECDDGNVISGDGCSSACLVENGWICTNACCHNKPDKCSQVCGDGISFLPKPTTNYCDDGNNFDYDGCNQNCKVEAGWKCSGGSPTTPDVCTEICGDGIHLGIL